MQHGQPLGLFVELLKRSDRVIFMDADHYAVADLSGAFSSISPTHSIMRKRERPLARTPRLAGKDIRICDYVVTGLEPMWQSGIMGIHHDNMPALHDAYSPMLAVHEIAQIDAAEQFCIGIALSKAGTISPHHMRIGDYNTRGKKAFAGPRVLQFFEDNGTVPITHQIKRAARHRLWRTPLDIWRQKMVKRLR